MTTPTAEPEVIYEAEQATAEVARILTETAVFHSITDHASLTAASEKRTWLKRRRAEIEAMRVNLKAPVLAAAKNIDDQFRRPLADLDAEIATIDREYLRFEREEERRRAEEERQRREEARREQERIAQAAAAEAAKAEELRQKAAREAEAGRMAAAAKLETRAEQAIDRAEQLSDSALHVPVPVVPPSMPKASGIGSRKSWTFRVVDADKVPRKFCQPDLVKLRKYVQAMGAAEDIPGLEIYEERTVAGRIR